MNKQNTEKILKRFPELYCNYYRSMQETCMCWGLEVGDGWFGLIWDLSEKLDKINKKLSLNEQVKADQVKEKFGGLRYYWNGGPYYPRTTVEKVLQFFNGKKKISKEIWKAVEEAELKAEQTCEVCGKPGKLRGKGWVYTACEEHKRVER